MTIWAQPDDATRATARWGVLFVILLLLGAGMFSAPSAADPVAAVRTLYEDRAVVVLVSQLVELGAAAAFLLHSRAWAGAVAVGSARLRAAGAVTAGAAALTSLPPLWLAAVVRHADDNTVAALVRACDLTDVFLFAATTAWAAATAAAVAGPLKVVALVVAALQAARAALLLAGSELLGAAAPVALLVLVGAIVLKSFRNRTRRPRPESRPGQQRQHLRDQLGGGHP